MTMEASMSEAGGKPHLMDTLVGPIENREEADAAARLLAIVVLGLAGVEAVLALALGRGALAVAASEALLGGLVAWRKSRIAAAALLGIALGAAGILLFDVFRGAGYAWALTLALGVVWAGGRAVHCTVAFHRAASRSDTPGTETR
jgi:hypothetical protein